MGDLISEQIKENQTFQNDCGFGKKLSNSCRTDGHFATTTGLSQKILIYFESEMTFLATILRIDTRKA